VRRSACRPGALWPGGPSTRGMRGRVGETQVIDSRLGSFAQGQKLPIEQRMPRTAKRRSATASPANKPSPRRYRKPILRREVSGAWPVSRTSCSSWTAPVLTEPSVPTTISARSPAPRRSCPPLRPENPSPHARRFGSWCDRRYISPAPPGAPPCTRTLRSVKQKTAVLLIAVGVGAAGLAYGLLPDLRAEVNAALLLYGSLPAGPTWAAGAVAAMGLAYVAALIAGFISRRLRLRNRPHSRSTVIRPGLSPTPANSDSGLFMTPVLARAGSVR
jgi:hypothetical protein